MPKTTLPAFTPVPRAKERHNGWNPDVQRAFIEALAETGSVTSACRRVNRSEVGAYLLRRHPEAEEFRAAWQAALDLGIQKLEDLAMERALNGVEVPVYSYGKLVGTRTKYNDRLLMFMLRNRAPKRFAEGKPKALNAVDRQQLARLKRQWRTEWEREHEATAMQREAATLDSVNAKLERMHDDWWRTLSPRTRAAYEEYKRLEQEDKDSKYPWWEAEYGELGTAAESEAEDYAVPLPPPGMILPGHKPEPPAEVPPNPRIITLKDEWD